MAPFKAGSEMPASQISPDSSEKVSQAPSQQRPQRPQEPNQRGLHALARQGGIGADRQTDRQTDSSQPAPQKGRFQLTQHNLLSAPPGPRAGGAASCASERSVPGRQRRCPARPPPLSRPKPNRGGPAPRRRAPHPPPAPPLTKGPVRGLPGAARLPRRALLGRGAGGRRGAGFGSGSGERSGTEGRGRRGGNPPNVSFPRKEPRGRGRGGVSPSSTTPSFHGVALARGKKN